MHLFLFNTYNLSWILAEDVGVPELRNPYGWLVENKGRRRLKKGRRI